MIAIASKCNCEIGKRLLCFFYILLRDINPSALGNRGPHKRAHNQKSDNDYHVIRETPLELRWPHTKLGFLNLVFLSDSPYCGSLLTLRKRPLLNGKFLFKLLI